MQCQRCKEHTATIHLTEIDSGNRVERHLCEECAQEEGMIIKNQIPLNELLNNLLAAQGESEEGLENFDLEGLDTPCPYCGMTLKKFHKGTLLGCPYDYEAFDTSLRLIIEKTQGGNTTHCGKVPSKVPEDTKKQIESMELRIELDKAVKAEDYETAAKLRDKIEGK